MNHGLKLHRIILIFSMVLCACQKNEDRVQPRNPTDETQVIQDLNGKTNEEILQLKYDRIGLSCQLWTQKGLQLDLSQPPNDSLFFDLKAFESLPILKTLTGQVDRHIMNIELNIQRLNILPQGQLVNQYNQNFLVKYSPYLEITSRFFSETKKHLGLSLSVKTMNEKIKEVLLSSRIETQKSALAYFDHLECELQSDIKANYIDQYAEVHNLVND